ncbi:MAG: hypothetical protein LBS26_04045 [Campylobacteraceae bacterium]|nr:hypothetical protein [Campylobacteraceae bacterium]
MAKYDDASWHYGGDYPDDLPDENAAIHIGMFIAWCIENDLMSDEQKEECSEDIEKVKRREMSGAEYLIRNQDEKFCDYDLNDLGQAFTQDYYMDDKSFTQKYSDYTDDFCNVFDAKAEANGFEYASAYHVEDTWENYDLIKKTIDQRFLEWKVYKNR